jgi:hypothetical protein
MGGKGHMSTSELRTDYTLPGAVMAAPGAAEGEGPVMPGVRRTQGRPRGPVIPGVGMTPPCAGYRIPYISVRRSTLDANGTSCPKQVFDKFSLAPGPTVTLPVLDAHAVHIRPPYTQHLHIASLARSPALPVSNVSVASVTRRPVWPPFASRPQNQHT